MGFTEQSAIPAESTSNNFPVEKPADKPYLRSRISHLLAQAEAEPDNLERWNIYQRIRELTRGLRTKGQSGRSWFALCVASVCVICWGLWMHSLRAASYIYSAPEDSFRIIKQINQFDFVMQRVHEGIPQLPAVMHFCHDYQPRFEVGMSLAWLGFDDRGSCQSIGPKDRGYVIERDSNYQPKLAPNCHADQALNRVSCAGQPEFN